MQAMLGGDGGGAACQRASAEPFTERREVVSNGGGGCWQWRCASEPAPGHERRPVPRIEPLSFGGRRTPERRRSGLHITGGCRAVCSRLMCLGVHIPPCRSRSFASWQPARYVTRIPSDSRHLLEFRQVLLRRGKQVFDCRGAPGSSVLRSPQMAPNPWKCWRRRPKPPALSPCRRSAHRASGLRPLVQTTVCTRLVDL